MEWWLFRVGGTKSAALEGDDARIPRRLDIPSKIALKSFILFLHQRQQRGIQRILDTLCHKRVLTLFLANEK